MDAGFGDLISSRTMSFPWCPLTDACHVRNATDPRNVWELQQTGEAPAWTFPACGPGTRKGAFGEAECPFCEMGTSADQEHNLVCERCTPGEFASQTAASSCTYCAA